MQFISEYVAPWALPKEAVPVHLLWEQSFQYDIIKVTLPQDFILTEFFNVEEYTQENYVYIIHQLKTRNFFGFTVASKGEFEAPHLKKPIRIAFIKDGQEIFAKDYEVNIFRPYVSFVESPKVITITDEAQKIEPFWVTLKLTGFGMVQIRTEIKTGGRFFLESVEPLYGEIIRRVITSFRGGKIEKERKPLSIEPLFLQNRVKEYLERLERRELPTDLDQNDVNSLGEWLKTESNKEKIMELMANHIESLLVDSLLFYFDRYPTDTVQMPQGKPVITIQKATQEVGIRFRYRDSMQNEYNPIEIKIEIDDKRKIKTIRKDIPVNIKWIIEKINPLGGC